jgi:hypothetical protein
VDDIGLDELVPGHLDPTVGVDVELLTGQPDDTLDDGTTDLR